MRLQEAVRRDASLRELIIQGLWPFKMTVFEFPWGGDAQSFMFQLATSTDNRNRDALAAIRDPHLKLLKRALKRRLPQLPGPEFEQRWLFFQTEAFAGQWVRAALFRHTERRARP